MASGDAEIVATGVPALGCESLSPVEVTLEQTPNRADTESVARDWPLDVSEVSPEAAHEITHYFGAPFDFDDPELAAALDEYHRAAAERQRRL